MTCCNAERATLPTGHYSSTPKSSLEVYLTLPAAAKTVNVQAGTRELK